VDQEYPKTEFFEKRKEKNHPKRKNSKTSRDMPKLATVFAQNTTVFAQNITPGVRH
jgi:hypothetical protein